MELASCFSHGISAWAVWRGSVPAAEPHAVHAAQGAYRALHAPLAAVLRGKLLWELQEWGEHQELELGGDGGAEQSAGGLPAGAPGLDPQGAQYLQTVDALCRDPHTPLDVLLGFFAAVRSQGPGQGGGQGGARRQGGAGRFEALRDGEGRCGEAARGGAGAGRGGRAARGGAGRGGASGRGEQCDGPQRPGGARSESWASAQWCASRAQQAPLT